MDYIQVGAEGEIGTITLDYPAHRNALCAQMMDELMETLDAFEAARVRVVVLRAAPGAPVWSAGHEIGELPRDGSDPLRYHDPLERALRAVRRFPAPVLGMIHGSVWGGATDLALSCDMLIGDCTASFAITPVNIGLPYNASGILNVVNRVGVHVAKQLFFTAEPLSATDALRHGVLNHVVEDDRLESFTYDVARRIARKSPLAISVIKEQIRILTQGRPVCAETFERIEDLRRKVAASRDYAEGINAFYERRSPLFAGE